MADLEIRLKDHRRSYAGDCRLQATQQNRHFSLALEERQIEEACQIKLTFEEAQPRQFRNHAAQSFKTNI
jgi:cobalamin biosynthesis protein CobT